MREVIPMEGKVKIREVEWTFYSRPKCPGPGDLFVCHTPDPVHGFGGTRGYTGGFDTMGEAIEVAVGFSARTNPYEGEVFDD
jgi:hypothetical protein